MQEVYNKVKELILRTAELDFEMYQEWELKDISVDSLQYIIIIVAIEQEFGIEFGDECLMESYFQTYEQLAQYIITRKMEEC